MFCFFMHHSVGLRLNRNNCTYLWPPILGAIECPVKQCYNDKINCQKINIYVSAIY